MNEILENDERKISLSDYLMIGSMSNNLNLNIIFILYYILLILESRLNNLNLNKFFMLY